MTPIRAPWSSFFGRQNSRFESHLRGGEGDILKPKKQLKVQYIGILKKLALFIDPPPSIGVRRCLKENVFLYWCLPLLTTMWFWLLCRSNFHSNNYIFVKASIPTCPMRRDFDCRLLIHASGWNKNYIQICFVLCSWVQQKIYYKFLPKSWKSN